MTEADDLMRKATSGDGAAMDRLLERHLPALRAFVRLRAGPAVAEHESNSDLVQSVCREVLEGAGAFEYRGEAAFKSWLFTTALRKIVEKDRYYRWITYLFLPIQYAGFVAAMWLIAGGGGADLATIDKIGISEFARRYGVKL